jgi:hypothetical protein
MAQEQTYRWYGKSTFLSLIRQKYGRQLIGGNASAFSK